MIPKPTKRKKNAKSSKWIAFRKQYLKDKADYRGMYQCEHCGNYTPNIEVDHIIKRSVRPDLVFDEGNLQLLCSVCHRKKDVPI